MSSPCRNKLSLVGPPAEVQGFVARANSERSALHFAAFVSVTSDGYKGERQAWGVKWGAYSELLVESQLVSKDRWRATYYFATANQPPHVFLRKVSAMYPGITFLLSYDATSPHRGRSIIIDGRTNFLINDRESPDFGEPDAPEYIEDEDERAVAWNEWSSVYYASHDQWVEDAAFASSLERADLQLIPD